MGFANVRRGIALSVGSGLVSTGTVVFANANGVTFGASASASSLVITASALSGLTVGIQSISAGTAVATGPQVVFAPSTGGLSFGASGQTITGEVAPVRYWHNWRGAVIGNAAPFTSANVVADRVWFAAPISATRADVVVSMTAAASIAGSLTWGIGLYTMAGSTASLVSSATGSATWVSGSTSTDPTVYGGQSGPVWRSLGLGTWNVSPGEYLIAALVTGSASTLGTSQSQLSIGANVVGMPTGGGAVNPGGGNTHGFFYPGQLSTTTAAFPNSLHVTDLVGGGLTAPWVQLAGTF